MIDDTLPPEAEDHLLFFRTSLPLQVKLQEVQRALDKPDGLACLEIGFDNAVMSYLLRKGGGTWQTVVTDAALEDVLTAVVGPDVHVLKEGALPFSPKVFDVVVFANMLERVDGDTDFVQECHRVLRPEGRLIAVVPHAKSWSLVNVFRRILGVTGDRLGYVRWGYTEQEIFRVFKHGFDVMHVRTVLRFFVETVSTCVSWRRLAARDGDCDVSRLKRLQQWANPFWRVAYQLDLLLLLTRGFSFIVTCKRHIWLPRNAPVLVDGRSIGEAVLSKAGE